MIKIKHTAGHIPTLYLNRLSHRNGSSFLDGPVT